MHSVALTVRTNAALKAFAALAVALCLFSLYAPKAHAAQLTETQVQAILGLLRSFGTDAATIQQTEAALRGTPSANASVSSTSAASSTPAATKPSNDVASCTIWTAPSAIVERVGYSVAWRMPEGAKGTLVFPNGSTTPVTKAAGFIMEEGRAKGSYAYSLKVVIGANTGGCTTTITVTMPTPKAAITGPFAFTTATPTISGTSTGATALAISIANPADGIEGFEWPSVYTPVVNGAWTYTSNRTLQNGNWTIIVSDPVTKALITGAGFTVTTSIKFGTYYGYRADGTLAIMTQNISRDDALKNCKLNSLATCVWDGQVIYNIAPEGTVPAPQTSPSTTGTSSTSGATGSTGATNSTTSSGTTSTTNTTTSGSTNTTSSPGASGTTRAVDLKVNGSDGPLALTDGQAITVSWSTSGYDACSVYGVWETLGADYANIQNIGTSGSRQWYAYVPGYANFSMRLRCSYTPSSGVPVYADDTVVITAAGSAMRSGSLSSMLAAAATAPLGIFIDALTDLFVYAGIGQP